MASQRSKLKRRAERGAALVEFSLSFPVYIAVVLGIAALVRISFINVTLQYVVTKVGREISLGTYNNPIIYPNPRVAIQNAVVAQAASFGVSVNPSSVNVCSLSDTVNCLPNDPSASTGASTAPLSIPGDWLYLELSQPVSAMYFAWPITVQASVILKNEPF